MPHISKHMMDYNKNLRVWSEVTCGQTQHYGYKKKHDTWESRLRLAHRHRHLVLIWGDIQPCHVLNRLCEIYTQADKTYL